MNDVTRRVLSGMSGDGFNERKTYIDVNNDLNRKMNNDFDNSLSKLRIAENKPNIETVDTSINSSMPDNLDDASKLKNNVNMYQNFKRQGINSQNKFNNMR